MKIGTYYLPTCNISIIEFWCTFFPRFWIPGSCYHFICNNEWLQTNCHIIFLNAFSFLMSHFSFQDCVSIRSKIYDPQGLFPWNSMDHINTKPPQATSKKVKTEICTLGQMQFQQKRKRFQVATTPIYIYFDSTAWLDTIVF